MAIERPGPNTQGLQPGSNNQTSHASLPSALLLTLRVSLSLSVWVCSASAASASFNPPSSCGIPLPPVSTHFSTLSRTLIYNLTFQFTIASAVRVHVINEMSSGLQEADTLVEMSIGHVGVGGEKEYHLLGDQRELN